VEYVMYRSGHNIIIECLAEFNAALLRHWERSYCAATAASPAPASSL
jgi:hypothetical protein